MLPLRSSDVSSSLAVGKAARGRATTSTGSLACRLGGKSTRRFTGSERPARERHLAAHAGHLTHLSPADRKGLAAYGDEIPWYGWVGPPHEVLAHAEEVKAGGATELLYMPAGDDWIGMAERFYRAVSPVQG